MQAKILICGEGYVGKTTIRERYMGIKFRSGYLQTIGADYTTKNQKLKDGSNIKLQLWDLAGQQNISSKRESFFKGADGVILVYDVSQPHTSEQLLSKWIKDIRKEIKYPIPTILVANKIDLRKKTSKKEIVLSKEDGQRIAKEISSKLNNEVLYMESSAVSGKNINNIFEILAQNIVASSSFDIKQKEIGSKRYITHLSKHVNLYFFKMTTMGPDCVVQTVDNPSQEMLLKMAIFYSTTLGQGDHSHLGTFGPVPIPDSKDGIQAILYSFNKEDKTYSDPRAKGITFCFIVITVPEEMLFHFQNKNIISRLFHEEIQNVKDVEEIDKIFLENLRLELFHNAYLANNV